MHNIRQDTPRPPQVIDVRPARKTRVPDHGIQPLASDEEILRQRLDRQEFGQINQDALQLHARLEQQTDPQRAAIGLAQRLLEVRIEAAQRVVAFARVAGGEEEVQGLGLGAGEEEFVDETAAGCEAEAAVGRRDGMCEPTFFG